MDVSLFADANLALSSFAGAGVLFAESSILGYLGGLPLTILKVAVGLGMVIFVHELGHFLVAKACGVKCEKFYVGFDVPMSIGPIKLPRTLGKFQLGETEYGIGIIPLGGYVKMLGQDDNPANAQKEAERTKVHTPASADQADGSRGGGSGAAAGETVTAETPEGETIQLDPRSYTAKPVWQRMAIISAGVTFNVISAVFFAAIAFFIGVPYTPTIVGATVPGSPAWQEDLPLRSRFVRIGTTEGEPKQHLRFQKDLLMNVVMAGTGTDNDLPVSLELPDGKIRNYTLRPEEIDDGTERPSIGMSTPYSLQLQAKDPAVPHSPAADTKKFKGGDTITAVKINGEQLNVRDSIALQQVLVQNTSKPITFMVERASKEGDSSQSGNPPAPQTAEILVKANPMRVAGLVMKMSPIVAVQNDSPAARAGLKAGHRIVSVDGHPLYQPVDTEFGTVVLGPISLERYLTRRGGEPIELGVLPADAKDDAEPKIITVDTRLPRMVDRYLPGRPIGSDAVGIAYYVSNEVAAVVPDSPAAQAGVQAGDVLTKATFVPAGEEQAKEERKLGFRANEIDLTKEVDKKPVDKHYVAYVLDNAQSRLPDTKLSFEFERGSETKTATLALETSPAWFETSRGLQYTALEETHVATSAGEALALGFRETKESLLHVFLFLKKLVSGGISPMKLGGPATIAVVAGSEAQVGISRLLIFLTLLSANLAIINFLPIPVLDGGHMVFLAYEGIRGKPVDEVWQMRLTVVGLSLLLGLMAFVISLDIYRIAQLFV